MGWWIFLLFVVAVITLYMFRGIQEPFEDAQQSYVFPSKLLLINMDKRKDRLANFESYYARANLKHVLPYERLSAVNGKEVDWKPLLSEEAAEEMRGFLKTGKRKGHWSLTPGAVGCFLSHRKALEQVVAEGKPMIICEDDLLIPTNFEEIVHDGLRKVPYNENTILLFHVILGGWEKLKYRRIGDSLYEIDQYWSMACYYVTPTAAKTILVETQPIRMQIDSQISELKQAGKLNIYAYNKVRVANLGTDIQAQLG